jgi:SAM-dependent methyltransferase
MSIAFDRAAGYYDETRGIPPEVEEQAADRVEAAVGPAGRLLEVGVGTGRVSLPLHRRGRDLVGVDLSGPMLDRYRAKAAAEGLPPPALLRGDATRLPFRDACVDAVLEVHVLHLIPDWQRALTEARRVLAPGGVVLIGRGSSHRGKEGPRADTLRRFDKLARELGGGPRAVGTGDDSAKVAGLVAPRRHGRAPGAGRLGAAGELRRGPGRRRAPHLLPHLAPPRRGLRDRHPPAPGRGRGRPPGPGPAPGGHPRVHPDRGPVLTWFSPQVSVRPVRGTGWEP